MDPELFWNYHESKGWIVGRAPMRSWRAAVLTWFRRDHPKPRGAPSSSRHPGWDRTPDDILADQGVDLEALRKAREAEK